MNKYLFVLFISFVTIFCMSCGDEDDIVLESPYILGLTTDNYPIVDGSTSTLPLNMIIACKLFGIDYEWVYNEDGTKSVKPIGKGSNNKIWRKIKSSQTHNSIINVIDKTAELTLSARTMSSDERAYAEEREVDLIETPIALDAFIFIVNPNNQIQSLTITQIQDIYTKKITNWNEIGESSADINPYVRNPNSGSQELMELLVMKDLTITDFPVSDFEVLFSMAGALDTVANDLNSICYTVYYYLEYIVSIGSRSTVKTIAIDEIYPNRKTISDKSYPYVAEVYAIIRSDLDESSMAYKIYEWLQTEAGKQVINETGYIPENI